MHTKLYNKVQKHEAAFPVTIHYLRQSVYGHHLFYEKFVLPVSQVEEATPAREVFHNAIQAESRISARAQNVHFLISR